jgi:serine/threonine protein kinase
MGKPEAALQLARFVAVDARGTALMRCMTVAGFEKLSANPPPRALLGQGNWGRVWRVRDGKTSLAVKVVPNEYAEFELQTFEHLRASSHPCLVRMLQSHTSDSFCSFVLEMCCGDLVAKIAAARQAAAYNGVSDYECPELTDDWLAQAFVGLEHMHLHAGVLHRDIKPGNLLLDENDVIKIADFGASHIGLEASGDWLFGVPPGSPAFAAPEIFRQEPHGPKADLYSFGALIYSLYTGEQPPTRAHTLSNGNLSVLCNDYQLLAHTLREHRSTMAMKLPADAQELILELTQGSVADRYGHAEVRQCGFASKWQLPSCGATAEDVEIWLRARLSY